MSTETQIIQQAVEAIDKPLVRKLFSTYVYLLVEKVAKDSGLNQSLARGLRSDFEILKENGFKPYALPPLRWILEYQSENGPVAAVQEVAGKRVYGRPELETIREWILSQDRSSEPVIKYFDAIAADYPMFFRGQKPANEIVFAGERAELWRYFFSNRFFACRLLNEACGRTVTHLLKGRKSPTVMELGSGAGGTTEVVFKSLAEKNSPELFSKYYYTDISPNFLKEGERLAASEQVKFPFETKIIDINKPITEQGVNAETIDLIYSVNCVHVAKDLKAGLRAIFEALKPGGSMVLCESVRSRGRRALDAELVTVLLSSFTDVRIDPELRPTYGFLPTQYWEPILAAAGFRNIRVHTDVPESGTYGRQEMFAIIIGER